MNDIIAAISTGQINQPISIIRVSGKNCFSLVKKIFTGKIGKDKSITYGFIKDRDQQKVDEVLISWFKGPNSFTGEDIVEINAHGGVVNTNKILKLLLINGARLALNGEFSQRAFLNGKMSLIKAEAIHDLIFAKTEEQAKISISKFDGRTTKLINNLKDYILEIIATIETNIDYPEYDDIEILTNKNLLPRLKKVKQDLVKIINASKSSQLIFNGINVAIIGKPNVGKSSILNAILNKNKAIVSNIPGTTRDIVEGQIQINNFLLNFIDTAGIHKTDNSIEKFGIEKAYENIEKANLILHVIDISNRDLKNEKNFKEKLKNKQTIKIFNKIDLVKKYTKNQKDVFISAKNKEISVLFKKIENMYKNIKIDPQKSLNNVRQLSLIEKCYVNIKKAIKGLNQGFEPSIIIIDITKAWNNLGNILGSTNQEDLLDSMFRNFCLGK